MNPLLEILSATPNPLFGQQRAYSSGRYPQPWQAKEGTYSDIGAVTGQAPAIYGFPLNDILKRKNTVRLNRMINHLVELSKTGVLIEFDWHTPHPITNSYKSNPQVSGLTIASFLSGGVYHQYFKEDLDYLASFFNQLKANGVSALFRPFHEMNGDWFWWGYGQKTTNTPEEYKTIFNFVVDYLSSKGVDNLAYVFAPNVRGKNTKNDYNLFYPGDIVDVIGLDIYLKNPLKQLNNLLFLNEFAQEQGKPLALTEFGYTIRGLTGGAEQELFFSNLAEFMSNFDFTYARTWAGNYIPVEGTTREDFLNNFIPDISLLTEFDSLSWSIESLVATQSEGNNVDTLFTFTITREGDISGLSLVEWSVAGSWINGADGGDFVGGVLPKGTAYFVAGEASKVITITVQGDAVIEPDESFTVSLINPKTDLFLEGVTALGVIQNDDQSQFLPPESAPGTLVVSGQEETASTVLLTDLRQSPSLDWAALASANGQTSPDILLGNPEAETVAFDWGDSTVNAPDWLLDFEIGVDKIDLLTHNNPGRLTQSADSSAATLTEVVGEVFRDADGLIVGNQALEANQAALVEETTAGIAGTYLVVNNSAPGFQNQLDLLINPTGSIDALPELGAMTLDLFFS
jgi:hypothetical protein